MCFVQGNLESNKYILLGAKFCMTASLTQHLQDCFRTGDRLKEEASDPLAVLRASTRGLIEIREET